MRSELNGEKCQDNPAAKLSFEQIEEVKALVEGGKTYREVGAQFGIHYNHVGRIVRGERRANG